MSKKRSINLLSGPISSTFQAQCSPSSSLPIRRDSGEPYRSTSGSNIDNDKTDWTLFFYVRNRQVKNFSAPLCRKQILNNFMMSLLTEKKNSIPLKCYLNPSV